MPQPELDPVANAGPEDGHWQWLYKVGGMAALIAVVCFRRNLGAELMGFSGFGIIDVPAMYPINASEWHKRGVYACEDNDSSHVGPTTSH